MHHRRHTCTSEVQSDLLVTGTGGHCSPPTRVPVPDSPQARERVSIDEGLSMRGCEGSPVFVAQRDSIGFEIVVRCHFSTVATRVSSFSRPQHRSTCRVSCRSAGAVSTIGRTSSTKITQKALLYKVTRASTGSPGGRGGRVRHRRCAAILRDTDCPCGESGRGGLSGAGPAM